MGLVQVLDALLAISTQVKCLQSGEAVAIKKVLQDKRYENRELQVMRLLDHPNIVQLEIELHYAASHSQPPSR